MTGFLIKNSFVSFILITNVFSGFFINSAFSQPPAMKAVDDACITNQKLQKMRSKEMSDLVNSDQKDREKFEELTKNEMQGPAIQKEILGLDIRDRTRRKRVGEIMGEGCLTTAADYAAAALIYQHGDVPDHYYQAFIWANRAVTLGDASQKNLVAMAIDRYLVSIGKKQLFGSQFFASEKTGWCYCLEQVEQSFPDSYRISFTKRKLSDRYAFLPGVNKEKKCKYTECPMKLSPSLQGSVPGFW